VTDSTADIPLQMAEDRGLRTVPMTVTFRDESFISGVTLGTEDFYQLLDEADEVPTTSQPNPAWLEEAYADAYDEGADAVVSVHISSELSGTCDLARRVAADAALPVRVVDSRHAGGALALAVLAALRAADEGGDIDAVAAAAERVAAETALFFVVDDLDALQRSGRVTGMQRLLGSVLRVKPVLTIDDGRVVPMGKVRTWSKAVGRLAALAAEHAEGAEVDLIVTHSLAGERADEVGAAVRESVDVRSCLRTVIGPVVGAHVGRGTVGIALTRCGD
jgi:DegV family protein with EDD domain